jgi:drug/metabolite transporter (DMT)-like permease
VADFIPLTLAQFAPLVMTGVFAMLGQYAITMAFTHAPARDISIFDYMEIIYVALISFALFGEIPDGWSLCGYLTVTGAAVAMYLYDKRKSSHMPTTG